MYGIYDKGGSIDRSCHIGPGQTSNCFDLNYLEDALYILYQKDRQSNLFLDSIEAPKRSEYGTQIPIDMSKAGPITPIPNPK